MFNHSIKVPRLYKNASKIAKEVSEGKGSIKQLVYESKHTNIKGLYALIVHTFQRTDDIEKLLKKSKLLINEPRFDPWLAKILIAELLWGKKRLTGDSKPVQTVLGYAQIFKAHLSDVSDDLVAAQQVEKPRYVRINTLKTTLNEAIEAFREEGWILKRYTDVNNYLGFLEAVSNLGSEEFMVDLHIPCLLIFPPKTQFYQHPAYKNGSIILQDKASCLPVHILNPTRGATIMDMCAAPGMKTTQTAAAIENEGIIYAVEIGTKRFNTLLKIVESSGATSVEPINRDVLTMTGNDCPNVEYIIVDPSCSGSGLTDRIEIGQQKQDEDKARLSKLAGFQIKILRHALTRFPNVKKVVYSTCSVYPEENEDVVRQVLETCTRFKLVPANEFVKNVWLNYGSPEFGDIGNYCLYAKPDIDLTSGFFVAVFERLGQGECNQFLNAQLFPSQARVERKRKILQHYLDENPQKEYMENENWNQRTETEDFGGQNYDTQKKKNKGTSVADDTGGDHVVLKKIKIENNFSGNEVAEVVLKKIKIENNFSGNEVAEVESNNEITIKKEKKHKKREADEDAYHGLDPQCNITDDGSNFKLKKKKHKRKDDQQLSNSNQEDKIEENPDLKIKKKKKKYKQEDIEVQNENEQEIYNNASENDVTEAKMNKESSGKKKKKHKKYEISEDGLDIKCGIIEGGPNHKQKKKKCKDEPQFYNITEEDTAVKKRKKKHKEGELENEQEINHSETEKKKKRKKKDKH